MKIREELVQTIATYHLPKTPPKNSSGALLLIEREQCAKHILLLIKKRVEGIESPYINCYSGNDPETQNVADVAEDVWSEAIQSVLEELV